MAFSASLQRSVFGAETLTDGTLLFVEFNLNETNKVFGVSPDKIGLPAGQVVVPVDGPVVNVSESGHKLDHLDVGQGIFADVAINV